MILPIWFQPGRNSNNNSSRTATFTIVISTMATTRNKATSNSKIISVRKLSISHPSTPRVATKVVERMPNLWISSINHMEILKTSRVTLEKELIVLLKAVMAILTTNNFKRWLSKKGGSQALTTIKE